MTLLILIVFLVILITHINAICYNITGRPVRPQDQQYLGQVWDSLFIEPRQDDFLSDDKITFCFAVYTKIHSSINNDYKIISQKRGKVILNFYYFLLFYGNNSIRLILQITYTM